MLPFWKSAEIGLFRPFSAFFALFRRARRAPGKSRKREKKASDFLKPPSLKPPFAALQQMFATFLLAKISPECPSYRTALKGTKANPRFLQFSAVSCENLRFSAKVCASHMHCFLRTSESVQKSARSAKICVAPRFVRPHLP